MIAAAAAFFVATPMPAYAQSVDLTGILSTLLNLDTRVTLLGGDIVAVNARLSAEATALAGVSIDLDLLSGRVDAHNLTLIQHTSQLLQHTTQIAANTAAVVAVNVRVDGHDTKLADIDVSLAENNVRIGENSAAIGALDTRVTTNTSNIANLDTRIGGAEARLDVHDDALADLDGRVNGNAGAIAQNTVMIGQVAQTAALARADGVAIRAELNAGTIGLVQQQGASAPVTVAASTGGNVVSFAGTSGDRRLTGVAAGVSGSDAANVAQMQAGDTATLASANAYTDTSIARLMEGANAGANVLIAENNAVLRKDMNAIAAGTSALAGLPQSFIPGRGMIGAAIGGKGDEVAFGMGLSKAFDSENVPVVRAGAAIDARRGTVSYNASVGFHF